MWNTLFLWCVNYIFILFQITLVALFYRQRRGPKRFSLIITFLGFSQTAGDFTCIIPIGLSSCCWNLMLGSRAAWILPGGDGTGQVNLLGEAFRTKVRETQLLRAVCEGTQGRAHAVPTRLSALRGPGYPKQSHSRASQTSRQIIPTPFIPNPPYTLAH